MNLRKIFDWTPVAVKAPRPRYEKYDSVSERIVAGYVVEIEYLYHGHRDVFFPNLSDIKDTVDGNRRSLRKAIVFYKKTRNKINSQRKRVQR